MHGPDFPEERALSLFLAAVAGPRELSSGDPMIFFFYTETFTFVILSRTVSRYSFVILLILTFQRVFFPPGCFHDLLIFFCLNVSVQSCGGFPVA